MGYYKVPQDIEAEDTILGPLTFKQMLFIIVTGVSGFAIFGLAQINILLAIPVMPFFIMSLILGIYRPKDQPVENKLAAYLGFYIKPRTKIWNRDGIIDHVTIRVPKVVNKYLSDNRTPEQVRSQLKQLAQVVDTRGWSTKQNQVQLPGAQPYNQAADDRLINPGLSQPVQVSDVGVAEDMFDLDNNPVAQQVNQLTEQAEAEARARALAQMRQPAPPQPVADDRAQTYPTQPQPTAAQPQNVAQGPANPPQGVIQPAQAPTQPQSDLPPLRELQPQDMAAGGSSPAYNPYPSHMHQHILSRDGTLNQLGSIDTPGPAQPASVAQPPAPPTDLDDDDKQELKQLADAELNIQALQRHAKEMKAEHQQADSGEMIIEH